MSQIVLKRSAADKLLNDPKIQQWKQTKLARKVPFLGYYRRSYSTSRDGVVTEYGDGFMLTTIDPQSSDETKGIVVKPIAVADDLDILIGGDEATMSRSFSVGWMQKFTYEPTL